MHHTGPDRGRLAVPTSPRADAHDLGPWDHDPLASDEPVATDDDTTRE
jgi:hypothetical protein